MEQFNYTVKDKKGITHKGIVEASSDRQAANILHDRGYTVVNLKSKDKGFSLSFFGGVGIGPLSAFTRQLATMVTSGLPLSDSLVVLSKQTENKKLQEIIGMINSDIQSGSTFAVALSKHDVFSTAYINVVKAGEASGTLDKVLLKLADNLEKEREFQGKIKGAMIYPLVIMLAMGFVAAIIVLFVVPKLSEVYEGMGISLPLPTLILMAISEFSLRFWWLIIIVGVGGFYALKKYRQTDEGALVIDKLLLKVPVFGRLNRDTSLTEFIRTLGILVGAGVPILESLKIAGATATNAIHRSAVNQVAILVEKGTTLSLGLEKFDEFPPIVAQMTKVGEETGKMDDVLDKVAHFFEIEVEQQVKNLTTALEPIIMVVLGIMVALLMISIILPIYNITAAF
jgi:type IV pilus assembly protein PilC